MHVRSSQLPLLLILSCLFLLSVAQTATACSCGPSPTVLEAFDKSDEVVIVRVLSVEKVEDKDEENHVDGVRSATLIVEKVFKGKLTVRDELSSDKVVARTASGPSTRNPLVINSFSI